MGESMDSEVSKAVNKIEEAPKRKHVRNIVILCWRSNGALQFYSEVGKALRNHKEPNAVCGYKALCVIHSVIQEGPPRCREDSQHQLSFLQGIANEFKRATTDRLYGPAIIEYVTFLTEKVNFHKAHPEFEGNLNLDEYQKKLAAGMPRPEKLMEIIGHLLDLQDACLKMDRHVFSVKTPKDLTECRVAALIPLTLESYAVYTMAVFLLKKLVDLIEDVNVFSFLTQRFYSQYMELKNMFFEIANVKYVASIISVPTLPRDPPQFLPSRKKAPSMEPEAQPAPNALNPQLFVQPPPWGNEAASVTNQWAFPLPQPAPAPQPPPVDDDFASLRDNRREKEFEDLRNRIRQLEEELARERAEKEMMRRELEALRAENAMLKANMQALQEAYLRERRVLTENELDAAVDAINGHLRRLDDPTYQGNQQATAESILASQAALMKAVEELERAARSGDQAALMNAVRAVTAALARLLDDVKGASRLTDDPLVKQALFDAARAVGAALAALLEAVKYGDAASFGAAANSMRSALNEMGGAAERLANKDANEEMSEAEGLKLEKFAESELMAAARAITEAAESIMRAKAARSKDLSAEAMQTGDAIMDSAFAITTVTGNLIKMAIISQQERVTKGRASNLKTFYKKERTFAEGLISAAKAVAAATVELVAVANKAANGEVDEEALIAVSKSITAATAQLVAASRVTSDTNSDNQRNLEEASKAVVRATQMLVEALRNAPETLKSQADSVRQADIWLQRANQSAIQQARAKQEIMAAIARADKEKAELQKRLFSLNKSEYKG